MVPKVFSNKALLSSIVLLHSFDAVVAIKNEHFKCLEQFGEEQKTTNIYSTKMREEKKDRKKYEEQKKMKFQREYFIRIRTKMLAALQIRHDCIQIVLCAGIFILFCFFCSLNENLFQFCTHTVEAIPLEFAMSVKVNLPFSFFLAFDKRYLLFVTQSLFLGGKVLKGFFFKPIECILHASI